MKQLFSRKKRRNRLTRTVIMGLLVVAACVYGVAYYFEIPTNQLLSFFLASALFVLGIMVLAILAVVLIKGVGKLFNKSD